MQPNRHRLRLISYQVSVIDDRIIGQYRGIVDIVRKHNKTATALQCKKLVVKLTAFVGGVLYTLARQTLPLPLVGLATTQRLGGSKGLI